MLVSRDCAADKPGFAPAYTGDGAGDSSAGAATGRVFREQWTKRAAHTVVVGDHEILLVCLFRWTAAAAAVRTERLFLVLCPVSSKNGGYFAV